MNNTLSAPLRLDAVPPSLPEAEIAVLGSMLLDPAAIDVATGMIAPSDFYSVTNEELFRILVSMRDAGVVVEVKTVVGELRKHNRLEALGGEYYLDECTHSISTPAHIEHYVKQVKDASTRRAIITAGTKMVSDGHGGDDTPDILDRAEKAVFTLSMGYATTGAVHVRDLVYEAMDTIEKRVANKNPVIGVPTGFRQFDSKTAGLQPGQLIILAARPGVGKTSMAMNIIEYVSIAKKLPSLVFSLEMSKQEILSRLISSQSAVDLLKIRTGIMMSQEEMRQISRASEQISTSDIIIEDSMTTISAIRSESRRVTTMYAKKGTPIRLILVDYLQLITGRRNADSRQLELGDISRTLKILGRELNAPIIALSQLNRKIEDRGDGGRPRLSDLRDSGCIEQDADIVAFIHRPGQYIKDADEYTRSQTELILAKQRNGPLGEIQMRFLGHLTKFVELEGWEERNHEVKEEE